MRLSGSSGCVVPMFLSVFALTHAAFPQSPPPPLVDRGRGLTALEVVERIQAHKTVRWLPEINALSRRNPSEHKYNCDAD